MLGRLARFFDRAAPLFAAALGLLWFIRLAGLQALDPLNHGWVLTGEDWSIHAMGWWFFRIEPWALPLGRIDGLMHPVGTSVAFTDSIPLLAVLLKPFSPLLPERFHYVGLWLGFCFAANAAAGAWVVRRIGGNALAQLGAGALLATTPLMLPRLGHEALCAHFLIIVVIGLHLEPPRPWPRSRRSLLIAGVMVVLASGIHPYLAAMVFPLACALALRHALFDRTAPLGTALAAPVAYAAAMLGTLLLFGYIGGAPQAAEGFGWWNAELYALVNSRGFSHLLPELAPARPHHEGFGYLGLGVLALLPLALGLALFRRRSAPAVAGTASATTTASRWRYLPLVIVTLGAVLFALATEVKAGPTTLFRLDGLFAPFAPLNAAFRSSGRFIWILHYTLALAAIVAVVRGFGTRGVVAGLVLLAAAGLQAVDTRFERRGLFLRSALDARLRSPLWHELGQHYRHLALVPPQIAWVGGPCEGELPGQLRYPFGYLAYQQRMTFNSSNPARRDLAQLHAACARLRETLSEGKLDPDTVYLPGARTRMAIERSGAAVCGKLDGHDVCVSRAKDTPLSRTLAEQRPLPRPQRRTQPPREPQREPQPDAQPQR